MSLTVPELRSLGVLDELARVFTKEHQVDVLLDKIGFPPPQRPISAESPGEMWNMICVEIDKGLTEGGLEKLLQEAARLYPFNNTFKPWSES